MEKRFSSLNEVAMELLKQAAQGDPKKRENHVNNSLGKETKESQKSKESQIPNNTEKM
ncbi:MAG: hypothetical protein HDT22_10370 [Ruminococcus sp.]|nr:hypothetical protein [Ruminococcus sp.]